MLVKIRIHRKSVFESRMTDQFNFKNYKGVVVMKKYLKRLLLLTYVVLFPLFSCVEVSASYSPITHDGKTSGWTKKTWYKYYMKYGEYEYESIHDMFPYYRAVDINGDGVKELILTGSKNTADHYSNFIKILTLYKNKIRIMKSIDQKKINILYFRKKSSKLVYYYRSSHKYHFKVYKMKKGKLVRTKAGDYYKPYHFKGHRNKRSVYTLNGKITSKKRFMKYFNKYVRQEERIHYKNTPDYS